MTGAVAGDAPDDRCPRCGGGFHCGANDPAPCACTGITLELRQLTALRVRYEGCLCLQCLRALARGAPLELLPNGRN